MPKQKKYENEIKSVWIKYFRIFLATISGFALSVIFVKFFTPEEYGSYSFIIQMSSSVLVITSLGLSTTLIRFIPEYIQKKINKNRPDHSIVIPELKKIIIITSSQKVELMEEV